jgi:murein DD-endopeptidase MepM/ murein hydrolase activator NlpD
MTLRAIRHPTIAAALFVGLSLASAATAGAADSISLPFDTGALARVIQGYNGGTHQGDSRFGLDLVLVNAETSGAPVLSPLEGSVAWAFEPGDSTGCIEIVARDGGYGVMLCHIILDRPYGRGEKVNRGQQLGTVGAAGEVGNNGAPHVHIELHRGGRGSDPVPFSPPDGILLDGVDLPTVDDSNENSGVIVVSSNAASAPPASASAS